MPWYFPWSESIKKRACRYLLQHYLGQFLKEKLTLDQLSVDLYNGTGSIHDVQLDVASLNAALENFNVPIEIVDGFIGKITVSIPWSALVSDSTRMQIHNLELTIQPKQRTDSPGVVMLDSMFASMTTSMELAQECLRQEPTEGEQIADKAQSFEGLESFAQTIEAVLAKVKVSLVDTIVRLEHLPKEAQMGAALEIRIERAEYFDDVASDAGTSVDTHAESQKIYEPSAVAHKNLHILGLSVFCDEFPSCHRTFTRTCSSDLNTSPSNTKGSSSLSPTTPPCISPEGGPLHLSEADDWRSATDFSPGPKESEPILIAVFSGRQELKLKLKQKDELAGPKVEFVCQLGSVNFHLSPRQVHLLMELAKGLSSPGLNDDSNMKPRRAASKPMEHEDFEKVERELQKELSSGRILQRRFSGHDSDHFISHSLDDLDDDDEMYFELGTSGAPSMDTSVTSIGSSVSSAPSSHLSHVVNYSKRQSVSPFQATIPPAARKARSRPSKHKDHTLHYHDDPTADVTRVRLKVSFLSVIILHEDPIDSAETAQSKLKEMASKFFSRAKGIMPSGVGRELADLRAQYSEACPVDHIGLLCKPVTLESTQKTTSSMQTMCVELTVGSGELVEAVFNRSNTTASVRGFHLPIANVLPEYCMLLVFLDEDDDDKGGMGSSSAMYRSIQSSSSPCLRLHVEQSERLQSSHQMNSSSSTKVHVELAPCETEVDITIVDRIQSLLNPQPLTQPTPAGRYASTLRSLHMPAYQFQQNLFSEAIDEENSAEDRKLDLTLNCSKASIILRFPIVDLRDEQNAERPWWQRCLHKEKLILTLSESRFETVFSQNEKLSKFDVTCKEGKALFQMSGSSPAKPFLYFGYRDDEEGHEKSEGFDWPRVVVKMFSHGRSVLEEEEPSSEDTPPDSAHMDSLNGACQFSKPEPSPFSSQKYLYDNKELVMPGNSEEMKDFQDKCLSLTNLSIEITLPLANALIPDKDFIETLYNRLLNDFALWKPQAPAPLRTTDPCGPSSGPGWNQLLVDQLIKDQHPSDTHGSNVFHMCKSAIKDDSSSDEESMFRTLTENQVKKRHRSQSAANPNDICFLLSIGKGYLSATAALKDDEGNVRSDREGEILLDLEDGSLLVTSGYGGDPTLQYMCIQCHKAALYHSGSVPVQEESRQLFGRGSNPVATNLKPTIYLSEDGVITKLSGQVGCGGSSMDMLSVAMKGKLDTFRNVKDIQLAVGLRGATLQHTVVPSEQNWLNQVMDVFDLKDYPVLGYTLPKVVTELHLHTWSCAVDYRPLYLPLRAMVMVEGFSISSNILAESPTSLLRFIIEDGALFLSDKNNATYVDLRNDYVCVLDMGLFELSLRSSDGRDARYPKTDLRATNNILHIRTCADSCRALGELITYIVNDGDLQEQGQMESKLSHAASSVSLESEEALTQSSMEMVSDEMAEAMRESSSSSCSSQSGTQHATQVFFFPDDKNAEACIKASPDSTVSQLSSAMEESDTDLGGLTLDDTDNTEPATFIVSTSDNGSLGSSGSSLDDDFCIVNDPGLGIRPKGGEPIIRVLTSSTIEVKENHFDLPKGKFDQLRAPEHFPCPVYRYMLTEMSLVWYMYGGRDFRSSPHSRFKPKSPRHRRSKLRNTGSGSSRSVLLAKGGALRDHDVLMELQLNKVRFQYELYPETKEQASWQIGMIQEVELRDRLTSSNINKFLYQFTSDTRPKQTHANMVMVKAVHVRPDLSSPTQECSVKVSVQPLRFNIDQDALFFLRTFFEEVSSEDLSSSTDEISGGRPVKGGGRGPPESQAPAPVMSLGGPSTSPQEHAQEHLLLFDEIEGQLNDEDEVDEKVAETGASQPVYIKSFIFAPDVPIRLDYHGKRVDMDQGTLAGLLVGLGQLNCLELNLKKIHIRHGILGTDRLLQYVVKEWYTDIIKNQLPNILGGVGPMSSLVQLVRGVKDLFWLPVDQYKKDGRIVRGVQRGASSFITLTTMSMLELTNKLVGTIQSAAEVTYDIVSPGPGARTRTHKRYHRRLIHPGDLREGMTNAVVIVKEGFKGTARNLYDVARVEHDQKGVTGAVGGVLRQIPPTVVDPIIITAAATSNVLGGMRNQLLPDRKREDEEKWKAEIIDEESL